MNSVELIGRLTKDPETRQGQDSQVATFTIAIDRNDKDKNADFPRVVCFGSTAGFVGKYLTKGRLVSVEGRLQTGSYTNRNGDTVYTTDVVAFKVEALDRSQQNGGQYQQQNGGQYQQGRQYQSRQQTPPNFEAIDEDVPY